MCRISLLVTVVLLACSVLCWHRTSASDTLNIPKAVKIQWSSINFKSIVEWEPKPTNYTYTVEVAGEGSNWKRKCYYTTTTECDVTDLLENVKNTYTARIISQVQVTEDVPEEFPYSDSPPFSPYQQTIIGKPVIENYDFHDKNTRLRVTVKDPLTPYRFPDGAFKSIRDIFKEDLKYTLFYRKASSTGKKQASSLSNEIVISVDKGESYCFFVQAFILSRNQYSNSQESEEKCTTTNGNELDYTVLAAVVIAVVLIVVILIALSVTLYKCRKVRQGKESVPLNEDP